LAAYVTQSDVESYYSPTQVRRAFSDDGSATIDSTKFSKAVARASAVADSILAKSWPDETARASLCADEEIVGCICTLVMHYGTSRRPEFQRPDGTSIYATAAKEAKSDLELIAAAKKRPATEADAGANPNAVGRTNKPLASNFQFTPTRSKPYPGGY